MEAMDEDHPFELEVSIALSADVLQMPDLTANSPLQVQAGNYAGHAKIDRLLFIAEKRVGTPFGEDALRLAITELSQASNSWFHLHTNHRELDTTCLPAAD